MPKRNTVRAQARRRALLIMAGTAVFMFGAAAAWEWTPLKEYADPWAIAHWLHGKAHSIWMAPIMAAIHIVASLVMFPNTVLSLAVIMALGPVMGAAYAFGGSLVAAAVGWFIGRHGGAGVEKLKIGPLNKASEQLRRGGFAAVLTLRLLPAGPFSVTNILAGAARVNLFAFLAATLIGIAPYIITFALFGHQARRMLSDPSPTDIAITAGLIVVSAAGAWYMNQRAKARTAT